MKLAVRLSLFFIILSVSNSVFAQETPLFPVPELSKFAVHQTCTDKPSPHKLILERYELYRETRTNKFPVNAFANVITIVEEKVKIMIYYVFDGYARIYGRQFVKRDTADWQEVNKKDFDGLVQKHLAKLPEEYFATGSEANHSMFASGVVNCK